jgi:hypothetical protein
VAGVVVAIGALIAVLFATGVLGEWNGKKPLVCGKNEWIVVDHVTAHFTQGFVIDAAGNCRVTCKECALDAPTVIRVRENASVHLDHGSANGATFYEAHDNGSVSTDHTKTTGEQRSDKIVWTSKAKWPTSGPFVCGSGPGGEFKDVAIKVTSGAAIVASGNCSVKLTHCRIEGPVALLLSDNGDVELDDCQVHATDGVVARANGSLVIEGGSFIATGHAAELVDNATLHAHGAKIEGRESTEGNAEVVKE